MSEPLWGIEARNASIANSYFTVAASFNWICIWFSNLTTKFISDQPSWNWKFSKWIFFRWWKTSSQRFWTILWIDLRCSTRRQPITRTFSKLRRFIDLPSWPEPVPTNQGQMGFQNDTTAAALRRKVHRGQWIELQTPNNKRKLIYSSPLMATKHLCLLRKCLRRATKISNKDFKNIETKFAKFSQHAEPWICYQTRLEQPLIENRPERVHSTQMRLTPIHPIERTFFFSRSTLSKLSIKAPELLAFTFSCLLSCDRFALNLINLVYHGWNV